MTDEKRVTLTVRLTPAEKHEADVCASFLGLPLSTFFRFAARQVFNQHRNDLERAELWPRQSAEATEHVSAGAAKESE